MIPGWLDEIENEVTGCIKEGEVLSSHALAQRLGVREQVALSYICLLASRGSLAIEHVTLLPRDANRDTENHAA